MEIIDSLPSNATTDSTVLLVKAGKILGTQLTKAMVTRNPNEKLQLLTDTLADARALRSVASTISDDTITDYVWSALGAWWKVALKYGVSAVKDPEGISSTTRNSTLNKFDLLIKFLKAEIAKTKLEIAQQKRSAT